MSVPIVKKAIRRKESLWGLAVAVGLVCALAVMGLERFLIAREVPLLVNLHGVVYDRGMTEYAKAGGLGEKAAGPVVVLEIGETTRKRLKQLAEEDRDLGQAPRHPVPGVKGVPNLRYDERGYHARVLENLRRLGAMVVVFDMVFNDDDRLDEAFAAAIKRHGKVILAATNDQQRVQSGIGEETLNLAYPNPILLEASAGMGMANVLQDADTSIRRFRWWFTGIDPATAEDAYIPALGVAGAAAFGGRDPRTVVKEELMPRSQFLDRPVLALPESRGTVPISYVRYFGEASRPAGPESVIPYEQVFEAFSPTSEKELDKELRRKVAGKLVLIGSNASMEQDFHRVPVRSHFAARASDQQMPGVEAQAAISQTALSGNFVRRADGLLELLLLVVACVTTALVGRWLSPGPLVVLAIGFIAALSSIAAWLLVERGLDLNPVPAAIGVGLSVVAESGVMFFTERKERLRVKRQLTRHVGPGVADRLTEFPELSGEAAEITMLFSDLQGFTSLSETMSSPEICALLNRYFGVMLPIVFKHGGVMDKLMGDGMMAYFGWVPKYEDHAARAVKCSLEIQYALAEWLALPENQGLPLLKTRVGIHSGVCTVGGIGFSEREEFTVIGDVVNVAARLESMNKEYGTLILISESTRDAAVAAAGDFAPMTNRGAAAVRGRKEPMPVYSVDVDTSKPVTWKQVTNPTARG